MPRLRPPLLTARTMLALGAVTASAAVAACSAQAAPAARPAAAAAYVAPHIGHVWVVQLENKSFDDAFTNNTNTYLQHSLPAAGALLKGYFGTGHASLDNYISQLGGQAPNPDTSADCQNYVDVTPGVASADGQVVGVGCVYPASVPTLASQLSAKQLTWKGYMEDMGNDPAREEATCGRPVLGTGMADKTQSAEVGDQYAARHNPFVYFHSDLDDGSCSRNVGPLTPLAHDLASVATTPSFSYITPNLCDDAHDATPCTGTNVRGTHDGGLVAADYWLQQYIPMIMSSPAFKADGMLIVTFDESSSTTGAGASSCCNEPTGPNTPMPGIGGPGGGVVGAVVLSPFVTPGTVSTVQYNHYSLLRSLEDIFGISTGGADGAGHIGYAGQAGLVTFGSDVFTAPGGAGPAPSPPPMPVPPTVGRLAITADRADVVAGVGTRLTVASLDSAGKGVDGQQVLLTTTPRGGTPTTQQLVTGEDGTTRIGVQPSDATTYTVSMPGTGVPAASMAVTVHWGLQRLAVRTGGGVTVVSGRVSPVSHEGRLTLRLGTRPLVDVGTDAKGNFRLVTPLVPRGRHPLQVYVVGAPGTTSRYFGRATVVATVR